MADKRGQAEIKTSYPKSEQKQNWEQVNLTPEGKNGIKTLVLKKNRVGLLKPEVS